MAAFCLFFILSAATGVLHFPLHKRKVTLPSLEILIVYQYKACYMERTCYLGQSLAACPATIILFLHLSSFEIPLMYHLQQKHAISTAQGREPGLSQEDTGLGLGREEDVNKGLGRTTRNI